MALKKICRCNKIIDYSLARCTECEAKYKVEKTENNKIYDATCRNKESAVLYHSKQWQQLTELCKSRFKGLDIYSLYVLDSIEYGSLSHHIEEISKNKDRIYDLDNLIYLTGSNHNIVHSLYEKDYEGTKRMLFGLVDRWLQEQGN